MIIPTNLVCVLFDPVIPTSSFSFIQLFLYLSSLLRGSSIGSRQIYFYPGQKSRVDTLNIRRGPCPARSCLRYATDLGPLSLVLGISLKRSSSSF